MILNRGMKRSVSGTRYVRKMPVAIAADPANRSLDSD